MFKSSTPLAASRSTRRDRGRGVTTGKAGKYIPLRFLPLFREDQIVNGRVNVTLELAETVRPLVNAVYASVEAWFVPFAAFPRFADIGDFNRSYMKQVDPKTGTVEPFIKTAAYGGNDIMRKLGVHMQQGAQYNLAVVEAYNCLVNHLYNMKSPNLADRTALDTTLAACFWHNQMLAEVVPNYDRSHYDGVVPVNNMAASAPVKGLGIRTAALSTVVTSAGIAMTETYATGVNPPPNTRNYALGVPLNTSEVRIEVDQATKTPLLYVPIDNGMANISLANIELAKKSAAFAALRKQYAGHDDQAIVELLMRGIRVPEYMERQPYLLGEQTTQFTFGTRYATDGASSISR